MANGCKLAPINFSIDWDKKLFTSDSLNPNLRLQGDYTMKGRILLLPIVGDGPCNVTLRKQISNEYS